MIPKHKFPIPEGVIEVTDEYQLNLAHYELLNLKPKGKVLFAGEKKSISFQFMADPERKNGIFIRLDHPSAPGVRRIIEYVEKHPRTEAFITITLLQFKMLFVVDRMDLVKGSSQKTFHFPFPTKFLKTHRRRFIRIPFNDSFPAQLEFNTDDGPVIRKVRDISREGVRIRLEKSDLDWLKPGTRLKQATLTVLERKIHLGLRAVSVYSNLQAGMRVIAISEEDRTWIKDLIRVLIKQILKLPDAPFDDEIEKNIK